MKFLSECCLDLGWIIGLEVMKIFSLDTYNHKLFERIKVRVMLYCKFNFVFLIDTMKLERLGYIQFQDIKIGYFQMSTYNNVIQFLIIWT